jgi:hypothetical protein
MDTAKIVIGIAVAVVAIIGSWKVYEKAGRPGWACLVPFYNLFLWVKMAGRPGWWMILFFLPLVNLVIGVIVSLDIARKFRKGVGFGIGIAFLPFVFIPILGLGDAAYDPAA